MKDQREINIKTLVKIRDDKENLPAVRLQSVQTMQKLIDKDDPQTKKNITTLTADFVIQTRRGMAFASRSFRPCRRSSTSWKASKKPTISRAPRTS